MATALLGILIVLAPTGVVAPKEKVFLVAKARANVTNDCLSVVVATFKTELAKARALFPAKSRADADIVIDVTECLPDPETRAAGELELSGSTGSRRGVGARMGVGAELPRGTSGRIVLTLDRGGNLQEFSSGQESRPLDEAARAVTRAALAWGR